LGVLSYSKPHTFSTSLGEEKERKNAFNLSNQAIPQGSPFEEVRACLRTEQIKITDFVHSI